MIRRPPRSTQSRSSAASDVYKRQANALLKTLEEPPGDMKFVLASEAAHRLLPTIRSRCLWHSMTWPCAQDALTWLQAQGIEPAQAVVLMLSLIHISEPTRLGMISYAV